MKNRALAKLWYDLRITTSSLTLTLAKFPKDLRYRLKLLPYFGQKLSDQERWRGVDLYLRHPWKLDENAYPVSFEASLQEMNEGGRELTERTQSSPVIHRQHEVPILRDQVYGQTVDFTVNAAAPY